MLSRAKTEISELELPQIINHQSSLLWSVSMNSVSTANDFNQCYSFKSSCFQN